MEPRYITDHIEADIADRMIFIGGPRQVGKTTLAISLLGQSQMDMLNLPSSAKPASAALLPHVDTSGSEQIFRDSTRYIWTQRILAMQKPTPAFYRFLPSVVS